MKVAAPHYFLNVPTLFERVRRGIEENIAKRGGPVAKISVVPKLPIWRVTLNPKILLPLLPAQADFLWPLQARDVSLDSQENRRKPESINLRICTALPRHTAFFQMLGIPVLQVYGLTETTAICTMDDPRRVEPGWVGPAIPGVEMKVAENGEIVVRGPNVFPGYWNRPEQTAKVLRDGWFHTGDQGEVNSLGNWRITGRIKNLIILNSGHNIAPEPIEEKLLASLPGAHQVVLVGNGKSFMVAIVTGELANEKINSAIEALNAQMPHYKRIHGFHLQREALTIESGLLTANGKIKRDAIAAAFAAQIEAFYNKPAP